MTLQEKLQNLLAAQASLHNSAHLPEAIRSSMYSLPQQIAKTDELILKLSEEIAQAPIPTKNDDNILF